MLKASSALIAAVVGVPIGCASSAITAPTCPAASSESLRVPQPLACHTYVAYSAKASVLVVGTLTFAINADSSIEGSWETHLAPGVSESEVGPQVGTGQLEGRVEANGVVGINLNPNYYDYNVFLTGTPQSQGLFGTWMYSTIAGPQQSGPFQAKQQP